MDEDFGFGGFDLGGYDTLAAVDSINSLPDFGSAFDLGSFADLAAVDALNLPDFGSLADLGSFEDLYNADLQSMIANEISPEAFFGEGVPVIAADYPELYGKPEDIAAMEMQDQLYSMGPEGLKSVFTDDTEPGSSGGTKGSYGPGGAGELGSYKGASYLPGGATVGPNGTVRLPGGTTVTTGGTVTGPGTNTTNTIRELITKILGGGTTGTQPGQQQNMLSSLLPLLLMMMAMNRGSSSGQGSNAVIPALTATQKQTPYTQIQQAPGYRPGQGGITYFNPVQYAPKMAGGGIIDLARALAAKRREQRQGLLKGRGDGVSDSIPAMIGKDQPARLARGEYVVDARTVAELGNGSTDAGAERLDEMRKRVHAKRKTAKVGQDSKASKELPA